jgi:hypothetical protein
MAQSKDEPLEVVMARDSGPDFEREWSVPGSNR